MPTYDYRCNECEHTFELFQSITADPVRECPVCGAFAVQRIIGTGGAIIFKGSGFYQTDYRSEEYKSKAKKEQESTKSGTQNDKDKKTGQETTAKNETAVKKDTE